MKRVAIVVQRCDESVVGGSEALAWQYAQLLSERFEIEVLTSTATDYVSWKSALPSGVTLRDRIRVRRFEPAFTRGDYWYGLHNRMMLDWQPHLHRGERHPTRWREALQDEYIRFQGPYCPALNAWLAQHERDFGAVLFCTYLYPMTYFGTRCVPSKKSVLIPTLHDEPPAYMPVYADTHAGIGHCIWLTDAERRTAARLWGSDRGEVIGMAVDDTEAVRAEIRERPYFLYSGRIEPAKGADKLLDAFARLRESGRCDAQLVFTGADVLGLPRSPDIEYLGFVDEERKRALMAGALAFVLPSVYESFSIVTLEAMAQRTPVLVNAGCEVMRDHIERSQGGFHYGSMDDMVKSMRALCALSADERKRIGDAGRRYVVENYSRQRVQTHLTDFVEQVIAESAAA
jgi:glycosyltransferase involved in cell wall biosynthesis